MLLKTIADCREHLFTERERGGGEEQEAAEVEVEEQVEGRNGRVWPNRGEDKTCIGNGVRWAERN